MKESRKQHWPHRASGRPKKNYVVSQMNMKIWLPQWGDTTMIRRKNFPMPSNRPLRRKSSWTWWKGHLPSRKQPIAAAVPLPNFVRARWRPLMKGTRFVPSMMAVLEVRTLTSNRTHRRKQLHQRWWIVCMVSTGSMRLPLCLQETTLPSPKEKERLPVALTLAPRGEAHGPGRGRIPPSSSWRLMSPRPTVESRFYHLDGSTRWPRLTNSGGSTRWGPMEWLVHNFIGDGWQLCCSVYYTTHSQRWTGDSCLWMTFAGCYDPQIATLLHRHFLPFWWHWECLWVGRRQCSRKSIHGWVLWSTLLDPLSRWPGTNMSLFCPFCKIWLRAKSSPLRPSRKH